MQSNPQNLGTDFPGIRLYTEDPKVAIRRQIRKTIMIAITAIVIGLILLIFAQNIIKKNGQDLESKGKLINSSLQNQAIDASSEKNYEEIAPYLDQIKEALPQATNLLDYQGALEETAKNAGVQISVTFSTQQQKAPANLPGTTGSQNYSSVDHTVEIKGKIANIIQFIKSIENLPYFVQLSTFKIATSQGKDLDSTGSLALKVFTAPATASTTSTPSSSPTSLQ